MAKNILLLGDSRRMGYQPFVQQALGEGYRVFGPEENGRWAGYTLNSLRFWVDSFPKPDAVHWNCGLWDLGDDYGLGRPFSLPEEYRSAVERTVLVLRKLFPGAAVVFATTMPTLNPDHSGIVRYNGILREVAEENHIPVDDLYGLMHDKMAQFDCGDRLHLNDEGNRMVAGVIAGTLKNILE